MNDDIEFLLNLVRKTVPVVLYKMGNMSVVERVNRTLLAEMGDKRLVLPDDIAGHKLERIGEDAFARTDVEWIYIPEPLRVIEKRAFCKCTKLKEVRLPDTLEVIGREAFRDCTALERLIIPASVKKIEANAFQECINLKEIYFSEGLEEIDDNAFAGCEKICDLMLPKSLRWIGTGAFQGCSALRFLDVGSPVMHEIEPFAFANTGLQFVTLRQEMTCILADDVFSDCPKLELITLPYGPTVLDCNLAECVPQVEICAPKGSYTEHFAQYYGLKFRELEED